MTASISTRGMVGADFTDAERENMYDGTLRYYLDEIVSKEKDRKIVFAENSGWNLDKIKKTVPETFAENIEFVSLNPRDFDVSKGKGYNELLLINQALGRSKILHGAHAFMKVTGRYPIYNIRHFLKMADKFFSVRDNKYYGDIKDHMVYDVLFPNNTVKWNGHAAYTVLFAVAKDFYKQNLGPLYKDCNDYIGRWIECVWYDVLKRYRGLKNSGVSLRFKREPVCGGLQGSSAQTIAFSKDNQSVKSMVIRFAGNAIRAFMPWFWL